jgi:bifunctional DNA-binding transcriptional regulator/antitoxin component of YhaV-PrlF toxin-antitoxin module
MTTLTVTARGQVTFRKDVLQHLGIRPGERIELVKLPGGRVSLKAMRPLGKIDTFLGLLAGNTKKVATLDEINDAAATGWAEQLDARVGEDEAYELARRSAQNLMERGLLRDHRTVGKQVKKRPKTSQSGRAV